jgi:hypothetical protein
VTKVSFVTLGRRIATLAAGLVLAAFGTPAGAQPPAPTYAATYVDCVTGNNQFWQGSDQKFSWFINQVAGADGATGTTRCDSYANDQYERPTDQTFRSNVVTQKPSGSPPAYTGLPSGKPKSDVYLSGLLSDAEAATDSTVFSTEGNLYFEFLDITRAEMGHSGDWMFFRIELFGDAEVTSDLERKAGFGTSTFYTVRLGNNANPLKANSGIAIRNLRQATITDQWSTTDARVFFDSNGDASGIGGVNVANPPDAAGDGYNLDEGNNGWLYVRRVPVTFIGPGGTVSRPAVELAFNYKKYNQDRARNFTPQSVSYVEFDAARGGAKDSQNYLWNDEYTLAQAGSPPPCRARTACCGGASG